MKFVANASLGLVLTATVLTSQSAVTPAGLSSSVSDYASIQEAVDRNPGRVLYVPAGDYAIAEAIKITTANAGLWGPGRIIQSNPQAAVIEVTNAENAQFRDLTLTRAAGKQESTKGALLLKRCPGVVIANVQVLDNWANANAISIDNCPHCQLRGCMVRNYSRIAVDDRTGSSFLGYAFNCIDGTGVSVNNTTGALIANNRIIESRMLPTPELKEKYALGKIIKKNAERGWFTTQEMWDSNYFAGWHQGSGLVINSGETGDYIQILGNYVENAAQGIDIHADHVVMANNIINNAFIGMKAMHGSRNVLILGNQFSKNDLWSIALLTGTASHYAGVAAILGGGKESGLAANIDGESIIADNIVSDFGYGNAHWNWPVTSGNLAPIRVGAPGMAEQGKPPVKDVIVQGNVVYDTGRDQILVEGKPQLEPPRYKVAVRFTDGGDKPVNVQFASNLIDPGLDGVANSQFPGLP